MDTIVYAARLKDINELEKSSSGGMFTALSNVFLKKGNAVVSAVYDFDEKKTVFKLITTIQKRNEARGSKYMQSYPGNIFRESKQWLEMNPDKQLLFIGMGCQAAGFLNYSELSGIRERVLVVDIICHGVISPHIWTEYAKSLENRYGKIDSISFKDKRNGWLNPTVVCTIGGVEYSIRDYVNVFFNECALRPSCYECPYATTERNVDITIGDYWGIEKIMPEFYSKMGNSLVLIHTKKGMQIFEDCKPYVNYKKSNLNDCLQPNLVNPTDKCPERRLFWKRYRKYGVDFIMRKYGKISFCWKVKRKFWKMFRKVKDLAK